MWLCAVLLCSLCWLGPSTCTPFFESHKIVDLSYPFDNTTIYWEENGRFTLNIVTGNRTSESWYQGDYIDAPTHGGTHIDAPLHFAQNRWSVADIPIKRLVGIPMAVVDVKTKSTKRPDYRVSVRDLNSWESRHGQLPNNSLLVIRTGRGRLWPDKAKYMGLDQDGKRHYTSIHPKTGRWLAAQKKIYGIGLDTPSIDPPDRTKTHRILAARNVYNLENMANLEKLPATGAVAIVLPMKIPGASGAPCRVIALLPERQGKQVTDNP